MIWGIDFLALIIVVICAVSSLMRKDLLGTSILFGGYSFMMCVLWAEMGAVDVAFTEATVGAGLSTVFFIATCLHTTRRTKD